MQLKSPQNRVIAALNHKTKQNFYTLYIFNFSHVMSWWCLTIDRSCGNGDFETLTIQRVFGNCFQGLEITYMKRKPSVMCFDFRTVFLPTLKSCPCAIEDFPCNKNNFCELDPHLDSLVSKKTCLDGGIPLIQLNG
ncbi:hypothetical protein RF11_05736 [Thelohanellus kitauei]|uniref:Sortilin C-terminal domain-containing protein n=1 Tax=Thelohanellus kitauei TaxID=669202 RepID=A0A0C2N3M7_THEKT|nr:hypothetical protein RF11_05736 [Thelohanellus kitauei]